MENCIFCRIVNKEIPANIAFEDDNILAFNDVNPEAPVHLLLIPKIHISSMNDVNEQNIEVITNIFVKIPQICKNLGVESYRIVNNCGEMCGQSVFHMHFHVLGGRQMNWPPG